MDAHILNLLRLSDGNPGAAVFLAGLFDKQNFAFNLDIMTKIEKCKITGTDLYVLFSDLCNKDYEKVHMLCIACPDNILKDACSRQDYSGRELVKEYL